MLVQGGGTGVRAGGQARRGGVCRHEGGEMCVCGINAGVVYGKYGKGQAGIAANPPPSGRRYPHREQPFNVHTASAMNQMCCVVVHIQMPYAGQATGNGDVLFA